MVWILITSVLINCYAACSHAYHLLFIIIVMLCGTGIADHGNRQPSTAYADQSVYASLFFTLILF